MPLGTIKNANIALQIFEKQIAIQPNWKRLGYGVSRVAYLGPDGVVYKVLKYPGAHSNIREHQNALAFAKRKTEFRIPKTRLLTDRVLAMEYVAPSQTKKVRSSCMACATTGKCKTLRCGNRLSKEFSKLGLMDYHPRNVLIHKDTGEYWAIDLVV